MNKYAISYNSNLDNVISFNSSQFVDNWGDFDAYIDAVKNGKTATITCNIALKIDKEMSTGTKWSIVQIPGDLVPSIKPRIYYRYDDTECLITIEDAALKCEVTKGTLTRKGLYFTFTYITN